MSEREPSILGLGKAVARAAPGAAPWAIERAVAIQLAAIGRDAGQVAVLADFATALTEAANGTDGPKPRR